MVILEVFCHPNDSVIIHFGSELEESHSFFLCFSLSPFGWAGREELLFSQHVLLILAD